MPEPQTRCCRANCVCAHMRHLPPLLHKTPFAEESENLMERHVARGRAVECRPLQGGMVEVIDISSDDRGQKRRACAVEIMSTTGRALLRCRRAHWSRRDKWRRSPLRPLSTKGR